MTPKILLIGHGAIAAELHKAASRTGAFAIGAVLVRERRREAIAKELPGIEVVAELEQLSFKPALAVECASHSAVAAHGAAVLRRGIDLIVISIGALSDDTLYAALQTAAREGGAQLVLPAGAVPGIDALSAAMVGGVEQVSYTSRKPPAAWRGTPAEQLLDLDKLNSEATFYQGSARVAARDYPKNANVAAAIALAGLGLDRTNVRMVADPNVRENIHEIEARGAFGEMRLLMKARPLADNPRTSSLAAYSAVRAVLNRLGPVTN